MKGHSKKLVNTKEDWNKVDALVLEYQNGNKEAGEILIEKFRNYFEKFYQIIKFSTINFNDRESRFFLSLFMEGEDYKALRRHYPTRDSIIKAINIMHYISGTYGMQDDEDIMQDLYMIFLKLANRYKPTGKSFGAYLCTSFVYELHRHIKSYLKDPTSRIEKIISFYDNYNDENGASFNKIFSNINFACNTDNVDSVDLWIYGLTCSSEFLDLTQLERIILVKYYIEDKNDREIGEELGYTRNSINKKRCNAIKKIEEKYIKNDTETT